MVIIFPDFETRSERPIESGQSAYSQDPTTELMCLSFAFDDEYPLLWTPNYDEGLDEMFEVIESGDYIMVAHSAPFEMAIWWNICVPKLGWPDVPLEKWHCTQAMLASVGMPRALEKAGAALGLPYLKDKDGNRLMKKMCKPRKKTKHDHSFWHELAPDLEKLYAYCRRDVVVQRLIYERVPKLTKRERLVWLYDQKVNLRGIPIDTETVDHAIVVEQKYKSKLLTELTDITDGEITTGDQHKRILKFATERGVNIDNTQAPTIDKCLKDPELDPVVKRVFEIRRKTGKASIAKYHAMKRRVDPDGRIRNSHVYGGGHTGRFSSEGVQTQNLIKGDIPKDELDLAIATIHTESLERADLLFDSAERLLTGCLRSMLVASEGHRLIICDFSAIEARVLAWLAGQTDLIDDFAKGIDAYRKMACKIYNMSEAYAEDDDYWGTEEGKLQRFVGKQATLGLGYGMGDEAFVNQCARYGVKIDFEFAEKVVQVYRKEACSRISNWWYAVNDAAINAVRDGGVHYANSISFRMSDGFLKANLPCGRDITYNEPQVRMERWVTKKGQERNDPRLSYMGYKNGQWMRIWTHGGKLVENIDQGSSRDFLVEAMVRAENDHYPVIAHVHDEVVTEVPYGHGSAKELEQILSVVPKWGRGCPIAAEGFESVRYRK
jgi:DNA polymerase